MHSSRQGVRNRRGSTIAIMSVMLFAMLAMAAFAIDLGSLRSARSEAQRAADAIALAGAGAFLKYPSTDVLTADSARTWALGIARVNKVRADTLDIRNEWRGTTTHDGGGIVHVVKTNEVELNVIPDSQKVRAWVRHAGVQTFFGGLIGVPYGHVQAMATAWASDMGPRVDCLKPFAMPDMWYESDPDEDIDGDHYMDPISEVTGAEQDGESWKYEPESIGGEDYYIPFGAAPDPQGRAPTGYGSGLRGDQGYPNDIGLPLLLKPQTGSGNTQPAPERMGNAFWLLDLNEDLNFKEEVGVCGEAEVGDTVPYESGGKTAVRQALADLINQDPDATWDQETQRVVCNGSCSWTDWTESPRVFIVALIDPKYWIANSVSDKPDPGSLFTNFVRIFLEPVDPKGPPTNIHARYIGPAPGGAGGPVGGPLVKVLQLIE